MKEIRLKYGCNPNQNFARLYMEQGELPVEVLNGNPGYINFLDALNGWQLVKELKLALGLPAAASFKHVSPAGAAVGIRLDDNLKKSFFAEDVKDLDDSPLACAYARARGTDRISSFGDWIALSDTCDAVTASVIRREVSDGVIAPGYTEEALKILSGKRKGKYNIVRIDDSFRPHPLERKQVFGVTFEQARNDVNISESVLSNVVTKQKNIPDRARRDLLLSMIVLKYTQSNSVVFAYGGQTIGVGAGQQSRVHCTRLAGNKADLFNLRLHPKVLALPFLSGLSRPERDNAIDCYLTDYRAILAPDEWPRFFASRPERLTTYDKESYLRGITGVSLGSDAFFPFSDNIDRARRSGVFYIAQPGGSVRDADVIEACDRYGIVMSFTSLRLFHH